MLLQRSCKASRTEAKNRTSGLWGFSCTLLFTRRILSTTSVGRFINLQDQADKNLDEILDHPLRVPYIPFTEMCIDLIRKMLDRDVEQRVTIEEVKDHPWLVED